MALPDLALYKYKILDLVELLGTRSQCHDDWGVSNIILLGTRSQCHDDRGGGI